MNKIIKIIIKSVKKEEGVRPIYYCYDYLVAKVWARVNKELDIEVGVISDSKKHITRIISFYRNDKKFIYYIKKRVITDNSILYKLDTLLEKTKSDMVYEFKNTEYLKLSKSELVDLTERYFKASENLYWVACILRCIDRGFQFYANKIIKDNVKKDEIINKISTGDIPTFSFLEQVELLKIALKIKDSNIGSRKINNDLQKIVEKYSWMSGGNYKEKPKTINYYRKEIDKLLNQNPAQKLFELEEYLEKEKKSKEDVINNANSEQKEFLTKIPLSISLKDKFKIYINEIHSRSNKLFMELSRRLDWSIDSIKTLKPSDIIKLINGEKYFKQTDKKENYLLLGFDNNIIELKNKELNNFRKQFLNNNFIKSKITQLTGRVACSGKVIGKVKIVIGFENFDKFHKGNILVVSNTTPDYVPIMKKATAIIAEEGGITAHVSIVSRELNIPCVVGVEGATQVLKDGDLVEVDADNGIVKILERVK